MENNFLVIVDVQPEFQGSCHKILPKVIDKINQTDQQIICFYVGRQLGQDSKNDVMAYYMENGVDPFKIDGIRFIEKDFGFFRPWMDSGVNEDIIIKGIKQLKENGINHSRDFTDDDWNKILSPEDRKTFYLYDDPLFYPGFDERMFKLKEIDGFELIGGARHECLAEIDIYLRANGKTTSVDEKLCYGVDSKTMKNKKR